MKVFYHSYDFSIYCHDGFFNKSAYEIDKVVAYVEIFVYYTASNQFMNILLIPPKIWLID